MEEERTLFKLLLATHERKAVATDDPCVFLQFRGAATAASEPLLRWTREEVCEELDTSAELVRHLLHQMTTYECMTQRVVALVFDKQTVLSDVLIDPRVPQSKWSEE